MRTCSLHSRGCRLGLSQTNAMCPRYAPQSGSLHTHDHEKPSQNRGRYFKPHPIKAKKQARAQIRAPFSESTRLRVTNGAMPPSQKPERARLRTCNFREAHSFQNADSLGKGRAVLTPYTGLAPGCQRHNLKVQLSCCFRRSRTMPEELPPTLGPVIRSLRDASGRMSSQVLLSSKNEAETLRPLVKSYPTRLGEGTSAEAWPFLHTPALKGSLMPGVLPQT